MPPDGLTVRRDLSGNRSTGDTVTGGNVSRFDLAALALWRDLSGKGSTVRPRSVRRADLARHAAGRVTVRPPSISRHIVPRPASGLSGNRSTGDGSTVRRDLCPAPISPDVRQGQKCAVYSTAIYKTPENTGRKPPAVVFSGIFTPRNRGKRHRRTVRRNGSTVRRDLCADLSGKGSTGDGSTVRPPAICAPPLQRHLMRL